MKMNERSEPSERPESVPGGTRTPVRMCVRCCAITDTPVVVSEVHQGTGPGFTVYACRDCAPHFPRVPDVLSLPPTSRRSGSEQ
ncbi:hypothetical protein PV729_00985 [Streptomyces europaeiscabiei]|uniref:YHS domain-containing protein n=1 Tax=Streptomyces europaeiscabiei TaxID=146819 RepID=A0ABU4N8J0_9ACTN|nr:hypothetical protein [Streptomyces europaeiscabiei]MDX3542491.1 hypothetical protein [Streptomyces europaeiscabiei]MDX3550357.1 hypothetical protein [Streptomyces europaeiscabiei]MDX3699083.1 hypothetical protein [Streptomyces europaeiscabiei]